MVEEYEKMTGRYFAWFVYGTSFLFCSRVSVDENGSLWTMIHLNEALLLAKLQRKNAVNYSVFQQDLQT